jgi:hypothetical protein
MVLEIGVEESVLWDWAFLLFLLSAPALVCAGNTEHH